MRKFTAGNFVRSFCKFCLHFFCRRNTFAWEYHNDAHTFTIGAHRPSVYQSRETHEHPGREIITLGFPAKVPTKDFSLRFIPIISSFMIQRFVHICTPYEPRKWVLSQG